MKPHAFQGHHRGSVTCSWPKGCQVEGCHVVVDLGYLCSHPATDPIHTVPAEEPEARTADDDVRAEVEAYEAALEAWSRRQHPLRPAPRLQAEAVRLHAERVQKLATELSTAQHLLRDAIRKCEAARAELEVMASLLLERRAERDAALTALRVLRGECIGEYACAAGRRQADALLGVVEEVEPRS